ncbi:MAG: phospho-sugar mutase [Puniceicoccales bacterium]|jgi:phosphoglucomutase|nr:phospho-sugar mutase [Puniceicoccales bacterium]
MADIERLLGSAELVESARNNIREFLSCDTLPKWARDSAIELLEKGEYTELNDRFFRTSEFGTGGIRGRTIGKVVAKAELGNSSSAVPEHASVGSVFVNDFNIIRATMALFRYCKKYLNTAGLTGEPSLVIAHDVRFFSKHFCELCASTWLKLGGHGMIFAGPRSTPQLSFSVRYLQATTGIVLTASHNPWHDNGFKAYFSDGAQMVEPHASGVIGEYNSVALPETIPFLDKDLSNVAILGKDVDDAYLNAAEDSILDRSLLKEFSPRVIFTPLHGVGAISVAPLMERLAIEHGIVESQNDCDPRFSTVKSPNPESRDALKLAVERAESLGCDIALATDPDGDRAAIAVRNGGGNFEYFSGNVAWSLLLEYRLSKLRELGILNSANGSKIAVVKTFVTTPLIDKIAAAFGVKCINTLTGFKWIGEKMADYEQKLAAELGGLPANYGAISAAKRRELLLKHSTFFTFGCEESYGCLSSDAVRDKDGASAVLMLCELAAHARKQGLNLCELRDGMFRKYGYFGESVLNIYYDGADGAEKIANILRSYRNSRPGEIGGTPAVKFTDFRVDKLFDADGKKIPEQDFFFIELENGCKYAVRASGTEPKIKFYMFCERETSGDLDSDKMRVEVLLGELKSHLEQDANGRAEFYT